MRERERNRGSGLAGIRGEGAAPAGGGEGRSGADGEMASASGGRAKHQQQGYAGVWGRASWVFYHFIIAFSHF